MTKHSFPRFRLAILILIFLSALNCQGKSCRGVSSGGGDLQTEELYFSSQGYRRAIVGDWKQMSAEEKSSAAETWYRDLDRFSDNEDLNRRMDQKARELGWPQLSEEQILEKYSKFEACITKAVSREEDNQTPLSGIVVACQRQAALSEGNP